jgi:16S rRNA (guanine(966)-N(2))-methyltransferase RsmD
MLVDTVIRVTGGSAKGRKLKGPGAKDFRPATGRVKEFIFSYLGEEIVDARCLDLFSGSGAIGIEAISRGAFSVHFIERAHSRITLIQENLERCGFLEKAEIYRGDVFSVLRDLDPESYQIIFADPPFKMSLRHRIVEEVGTQRVLDSGGLLILEHEQHDPDPGEHSMRCIHHRRFGSCAISVYTAGN